MIKFVILLTINNTLGIHSHFDKQMLTNGLNFYNLPKHCYQISILESGHLKSNIAIKKYNIFGLKTKKGYKKFQSHFECLRYFSNLWQEKFKKYFKSPMEVNYDDFLLWWGYKSGKRYKDYSYVNYLKKIN